MGASVGAAAAPGTDGAPAAMAWPRANAALKIALVAAAAATSLAGLAVLPIGLSFFSAISMLVAAAWALWPWEEDA